MKSAYPGFGLHLRQGSEPSVATNSHGDVIVAFTNNMNSIFCKIGKVNGGDIDWGNSYQLATGSLPTIALDDGGNFLLGYQKTSSPQLAWVYGRIDTDNKSISSHSDEMVQSNVNIYANTPPVVAFVGLDVAVAAIQTDHATITKYILSINQMVYSSGQPAPIVINQDSDVVVGTNACIASNENGKIIFMYLNANSNHEYNALKVCYKMGELGIPHLGNQSLSWHSEILFTYGNNGASQLTTDVVTANPSLSVALTEDSAVMVYSSNSDLFCISGSYSNGESIITWGNSYKYDGNNSGRPSIAASDIRVTNAITGLQTNNTYIVQVNHTHGDNNEWTIKYSVSLITDHAQWMKNLSSVIGSRRLGQITMPASHDAGMFEDWTVSAAKTQSLTMFEQLMYGVRYFDLRIDYDSTGSTDNKYEVYHGAFLANGVNLPTLLQDVKDFMDNEQSRELVILKFSHFNDFGASTAGNSIYQGFTSKITEYLSSYLCSAPSASQGKFGNMTLDQILNEKGRVMVVCDDNYSINNPCAGVYTYRDGALDCSTDSGRLKLDPDEGDLVVWDCYSNTTDYEDMKKDQILKYNNYKGKCTGIDSDAVNPEDCSDKSCNMFLLSWTLTPWTTAVWDDSLEPDAKLSQVINTLQHNSHGKVVNLLYVNYIQHSRTTSISILMNQGLMPVVS